MAEDPPGDVRTIGHIATRQAINRSTINVPNALKRFIRRSRQARWQTIFQTYQNTKNLAKQIEWLTAFQNARIRR